MQERGYDRRQGGRGGTCRSIIISQRGGKERIRTTSSRRAESSPSRRVTQMAKGRTREFSKEGLLNQDHIRQRPGSNSGGEEPGIG